MHGGRAVYASCHTFSCKKHEFHIFIFPLVCSRTLQNITFLLKSVWWIYLWTLFFHLIQLLIGRPFRKRANAVLQNTVTERNGTFIKGRTRNSCGNTGRSTSCLVLLNVHSRYHNFMETRKDCVFHFLIPAPSRELENKTRCRNFFDF